MTCQKDCLDNTFSCGDGQRISQILKCDGTADCSNLVDEENCTMVEQARCNHTTQSTCDDGACILSSWWCAGDADCPDRSDENQTHYLSSAISPNIGGLGFEFSLEGKYI